MADPRGLVVVGASAGGVEALQALVRGLPAGFEGAVCVVLHIPRMRSSALPNILDRAGPLPALNAEDGMPIRAGSVFVAPANTHLLIHDGHLRLSHGPAENGHRPAVDPLFRSAARWWGPAVTGVVLSGNRDDGAFGLAEIVRRGGAALVQDVDEALYPSMPQHAAVQVPDVRSLPARELGPALALLLDGLPKQRERPPVTETLDAEDAMAALDDVSADDLGGVPAGFGCPSCHGALFELPGPGPRYRCRVGHAWTAPALMEELGESLEGALWMALRSLEEKAALTRRMAVSAEARGDRPGVARFRESGAEAEEAGQMIRRLIDRLAVLEEDPS